MNFFIIRKKALVFYSHSQKDVIFILSGISNYGGLLSALVNSTKGQNYLKYKKDAFMFQKLIDKNLMVKDCAIFRR